MEDRALRLAFTADGEEKLLRRWNWGSSLAGVLSQESTQRSQMVEARRLELLTSSLQSWRSTN